jgi:hypothetical protein
MAKIKALVSRILATDDVSQHTMAKTKALIRRFTKLGSCFGKQTQPKHWKRKQESLGPAGQAVFGVYELAEEIFSYHILEELTWMTQVCCSWQNVILASNRLRHCLLHTTVPIEMHVPTGGGDTELMHNDPAVYHYHDTMHCLFRFNANCTDALLNKNGTVIIYSAPRLKIERFVPDAPSLTPVDNITRRTKAAWYGPDNSLWIHGTGWSRLGNVVWRRPYIRYESQLWWEIGNSIEGRDQGPVRIPATDGVITSTDLLFLADPHRGGEVLRALGF